MVSYLFLFFPLAFHKVSFIFEERVLKNSNTFGNKFQI